MNPSICHDRDGQDDQGTTVRLRFKPHPIYADPTLQDPGVRIGLCFHNTYWQDLGHDSHDLTFHFGANGNIWTAETDPLQPVPEPPNYILNCGDIGLWLDDDEESTEPKPELELPPTPTYNTNRFVEHISTVPHYYYIAVILILLVSLVVRRLAYTPMQPTPAPITLLKATRVKRSWPQGIPADMPIYDSYITLCWWLSTLARPYINTLNPKHVRNLHKPQENLCDAVLALGSIWDTDQRKLHTSAFQYYTAYERGSGLVHAHEVDVHKLCGRVTHLLHVVSNLFTSSTASSMTSIPIVAYGPLYRIGLPFITWSLKHRGLNVTGPDMSQWEHVKILQDAVNGAASLNANLEPVMRQLIQLRYNINETFDLLMQLDDIVRDMSSAPSWWIWSEHARQTKQITRLWSSDSTISVRRNLTIIQSTINPLIDTLDEILHEEDKLSQWLQDLIDYGPESPCDNDAPPQIGGYINPWAMYRPADEMRMTGAWSAGFKGCVGKGLFSPE
ncbi:hypothetical protein ACHAQD_008389 [Fusarium lateritium]